MSSNIRAILESLLLVMGEDGLTIDEIVETLEIEASEALMLFEEISQALAQAQGGVRLEKVGRRYRYTSIAEAYPYIERIANLTVKANMSKAALETLAIIAYLQPVTRSKIEELRGVRSDRMLQNLEHKGLIASQGTRGEVEYVTSEHFLDHFGLKSIEELQRGKLC